jgi:hypothetical protein
VATKSVYDKWIILPFGIIHKASAYAKVFEVSDCKLHQLIKQSLACIKLEMSLLLKTFGKN